MAKRAEIQTAVTGTDAGIRDLGGLEDAFKRLGKTGQSVGAILRDAHKEWSKPTSVSTAVVKLGAQVIGQQIKDAASAIAEPAKTSYAQALSKAVEYRDATQRIATSTGKGYSVVGDQINATAQRLGLLPGRVSDYSRSVRQLTGDWGGAMSGLDAYQNRALKTDRTLEQLIPTAATLATTFGLKSTEDVNRFFGTLDRQAKNAGMSAEIAERAFMSASGSLAMLTNAKPAQLSALTTAMMAGAPTPEMGASRIGAVGGLLQNHMRYVEARMRKSGKLAKGEHLYDEQGQMRGDKMFDALEFLQGDLSKFYGSKDKKELIGRISQSGMMPMQDAAGLVNLDVAKLRKEAQPGGAAADVVTGHLASGAGRRDLANTGKDIRDIGLGAAMLPAQDMAVAAGGGAAGIALASAGQVFDKAVGTFWSAVEIFAGRAATGGAAAAGGAGTGAAAGGAAGGAARGTVGALVATVGAGTAALAGGALFLQPDLPPGVANAPPEQGHPAPERELAERRQGGLSGWVARTFGSNYSDAELEQMAAQQRGGGQGAGGPAVVTLDSASADAIGAAAAKHLGNKTLRTQSIQVPSAPPGQPQPL